MLFLGLDELLRVYNDPLLLDMLSIQIQMTGGRACSLPSDPDTITLCLTFFHLFSYGHLRRHE